MGRIEADIALESCLFRFQACSGQSQFTLAVQILALFEIQPFTLLFAADD